MKDDKLVEEHKKIDMKHSFCPVCYEKGKQEMIEAVKELKIIFDIKVRESGESVLL